MPRARKVIKRTKQKGPFPTGIRLSERQKEVAKQAAKLESEIRGRTIGWTTLVGDKGIEWCQRRVRREKKASAA